MPHGHPPGWAPQEIGLFIDSKCRGGKPLPHFGEPLIAGDVVKVAVTAAPPTSWKIAELHYTTDDGPRSKRNWTSVPAEISTMDVIESNSAIVWQTNEVTAPKPPPEANTWFLTITDERDAMVSTVVGLTP